MTDLATVPVNATTTAADCPDVLHVTCCEDDGVALCGTDVRSEPWGRQNGEEDCKVCVRIDEADANELGGCARCPLNLFPHSDTWGAS